MPKDYVYNPKLVSPECRAFIAQLDAAHKEWQQRRAKLKGTKAAPWWYSPATGLAEPKVLVKAAA